MTEKKIFDAIALVSDQNQIDYLLSYQSLSKNKEIYFICLTPSAEYYASKRGVKFSSSEKVYNPAEFMKISSEGFPNCELLAKYIDTQLDYHFKNVCTKFYFSSMNFIYYLKTFYDSILRTLHISQSVINELEPTEIICFVDDKIDYSYGINFYIGDILFRSLELLNNHNKFKLIKFEIENSEKNVIKTGEKKLRNKINLLMKDKLNIDIDWNNLENRNFPIKSIIKQLIQFALYKLNEKAGSKTVVIGRSNTLAQLTEYIKGWRENGGKTKNIVKTLDEWESTSIEKSQNTILESFDINFKTLDNFWKKIKENQEFKEFFNYNKINFFKIAEPWLEKYFTSIFPTCVYASEIIEKKLKRYNPYIYLTSSLYYKTDISAVLACKRLGAKVCTVQHGATGHIKAPIFKYSDYYNIDFSYVYGQNVANFFQKEFSINANSNLAIPIPTGNPFIKNLSIKYQNKPVDKDCSENRRVLYVDTHLTPDFFYYGWNCYPNIWYSCLQRKIVDIFKQYPEIILDFKLYPATTLEQPITQYVQDRKITNVKFLPYNLNMALFLDKADLLILDFPTTSLLNMICTRKPIIVYYNPDFLKMTTDAQILLKKRTELCVTEEQFLSAIERYCKSSNWPEIEKPNDEFLISYGLNTKESDPKKIVAYHLKKLKSDIDEDINF